MIVVALIAVAAGVASLALRDPAAARLDTEAARLSALLDGARAESRASGLPVCWWPQGRDDSEQFRFDGLDSPRPGDGAIGSDTRWRDPDVTAEVVGAKAVVLGPEPVIGAQRIVLRLGETFGVQVMPEVLSVANSRVWASVPTRPRCRCGPSARASPRA